MQTKWPLATPLIAQVISLVAIRFEAATDADQLLILAFVWAPTQL